MGAFKRSKWVEDLVRNLDLYDRFFEQILNLAINRIEWKNLPKTCDERFLELGLFVRGQMLFFQDDVYDEETKGKPYYCLNCTVGGPVNMYGIPKERQAYTVDADNPMWHRNESNSVIIYNNRLHRPSAYHIESFAYRLYSIMSALNINMEHQKTPFWFKGPEEQMLSMENIYQRYRNNAYVFFGDNSFSPQDVQLFLTPAPFLGHDLFTMYVNTWSDIYTWLGIESQMIEKRERIQTAEINAGLATVEANRLTIMTERETAAKKINEMFGLNIEPTFRQITVKDGLTDIPSNRNDDNIEPIWKTTPGRPDNS